MIHEWGVAAQSNWMTCWSPGVIIDQTEPNHNHLASVSTPQHSIVLKTKTVVNLTVVVHVINLSILEDRKARSSRSSLTENQVPDPRGIHRTLPKEKKIRSPPILHPQAYHHCLKDLVWQLYFGHFDDVVRMVASHCFGSGELNAPPPTAKWKCPDYWLKIEWASGFFPFSMVVLFPIPSLLNEKSNVFHLLLYVTIPMPGAQEYTGWEKTVTCSRERVRAVDRIPGAQEDGKRWRLGASSYPISTSLKAQKFKTCSELQGGVWHWNRSPFVGTDLLGLPGLRSRWPAGPVLVSQNPVCRHCVIINSFPPLRVARSSPPPATPTKLVEINRGIRKTEPWCPFVWGRLQPRIQALNYPPSRTAFWYYS